MPMPVPHLSRSIAGHKLLVTGAASGMGRASAIIFAREGAHVAVIDVDGQGAHSVATEIKEEGGQALSFALDLADSAAIARDVPRIAEQLGGVDILLNNAGISAHVPIDAPDYDAQWSRHLAILLSAQQQMIRASLPYLRRAPHPRIINIASTEALGATAGLSAYAAAKAGVVGLTRALAVELGREKITVNCICPGPIETGMTAAITAEDKARFAGRRTALRRYGQPEEVAHISLSLALPAASYISGAIIPVDGGLMARNA